MRKSLTNKVIVWLNLEEDMYLLEHLNMFNQLFDQLYNVDVKVEEEDKFLDYYLTSWFL